MVLYQKCFSTLGCPEFSLEQVISLAKRFQISTLELRCLSGRMDLPVLLASAPGGWKAVRAQVEASGLKVAVLGSSFRLMVNDSKSREELVEFSELAEALEVPYVRVFPYGGGGAKPLSEEEIDRAVEAVDWWRGCQKKSGWKTELLLETHDCFTNAELCLSFLKKCQNPPGLIWDTHVTWRSGGENPTTTWEQLKPWIRHLHLKDSISKPNGRHPYTYVLPGCGEMPFRSVLDLLEKDGYAGAISMEWEKKWYPELDDLEKVLEASDQNVW